jgi:hypothetical protein
VALVPVVAAEAARARGNGGPDDCLDGGGEAVLSDAAAPSVRSTEGQRGRDQHRHAPVPLSSHPPVHPFLAGVGAIHLH